MFKAAVVVDSPIASRAPGVGAERLRHWPERSAGPVAHCDTPLEDEPPRPETPPNISGSHAINNEQKHVMAILLVITVTLFSDDK